MAQVLISLTSGLVGAILGVLGAMQVNRVNRRHDAVDALVALVYPIGFKAWWKPDDGKPALGIHERYAELWAAYVALRKWLPSRKRTRLDSAWKEFAAIDWYDDIPDNEPGKVFQKGTHMSREEVVQKSQQFIRFLTELR